MTNRTHELSFKPSSKFKFESVHTYNNDSAEEVELDCSAGSLLTSNQMALKKLFDDLGHTAGANGAATLADSEAEAFLHGDRVDEVASDAQRCRQA